MQSDDGLDKSPDKSPSQQWQGFKFFCGNSGRESNNFESDDIIPLSQARAGDIISIVEILSIDCIEDLKNMGLIPGKEIQVISRTTTGFVMGTRHSYFTQSTYRFR